MSDRLAAAIEWICRGYQPAPRAFAALRIVFALKLLLFSGDVLWIGEVPAQFYSPPPGPFMLLSGQPSVGALIALTVVRALVAIWLLVGWRTIWASVVMTVVLLLCAGLSYSFGKVDHFILFDLAPLACGLAGWGAAWSLDARRRARTTSGYPLFLFATVVGFAMFTAALPKAVAGWLDPARQATHYFVARDDIAGPVPGLLGELVLSIDNALFWKAMDLITVFAEGWLVFVVVLPGLFRLGLLLIAAFHVGVFLMMGIDFFDNLYAYAAFFCLAVGRWFPEADLLRTIRRRRREPAAAT